MEGFFTVLISISVYIKSVVQNTLKIISLFISIGLPKGNSNTSAGQRGLSVETGDTRAHSWVWQVITLIRRLSETFQLSSKKKDQANYPDSATKITDLNEIPKPANGPWKWLRSWGVSEPLSLHIGLCTHWPAISTVINTLVLKLISSPCCIDYLKFLTSAARWEAEVGIQIGKNP